MQILRSATVLASLLALAPATVVDSGAADAHRPRKHGRHGRSSLRRGEVSDGASLGADFVAKLEESEWESNKGMLHLEAAEVETEAATDIQKQEALDRREEHQELAAKVGAEKAQVESEAARDWEAVARAAEAEALRLQQDAAVEVNEQDAGAAQAHEVRAAAPAASPGPSPGPKPADFSWAYDMDQSKPAPEQGFAGERVQHLQGDTMTGDWQGETAVDAGRELCRVCKRHPENSWCQGKCRGPVGVGPVGVGPIGVGGQAASPHAPVTEAVEEALEERQEPPAPASSDHGDPQPPVPSSDAGAVETREKEKEKAGGIFDPIIGEKGIFGKKGAIAEAFRDLFGPAMGGAAGRGGLAALLPVALMLASQ